ncbi:MAG: HAMP domain-containing protein [Verrucomicrobia bacterium]|nr:HAMP domain-containing protein [Verrucomicrobiota bacterium]
MTSFRVRLALLVGGTTAALLLGAGLVAWNFASGFNLERLDRELHELARRNLVRVPGPGNWGRLDAALSLLGHGEGPPAYVIWARTYQRDEYRSPGWPADLDPASLPVPAAYEGGITLSEPPPPPRKSGLSAQNPSLPIRQTAFRTVSAGGSTWRLAVTGNPYTTLVLGVRLEESTRDLDRLRDRYLAAVPAVLLLVGLGAWWLATRALRPVAALTEAAESITAQGLSQRIAAPAHDREFGRLVTVFNAMLDRLERSFQQARRFSADASHELKTPLALLQAEVEQGLRAEPPGSPAQQTYRSLLEEIHRLKSILDKLLLLSLADSGHLRVERTPLDLSRLVEGLAEDTEEMHPEFPLARSLAPGVSVAADATLLEQALRNLLGNAAKFNRPQGNIRLELLAAGTEALLRIGNSGPGIPKDDLPRLFERFYRGDPARRRDRPGGAGLGLSLAREILRAHGGEVRLLRSEPDWTEFEARLPLNTVTPPTTGPRPAAAAPDGSTPPQ